MKSSQLLFILSVILALIPSVSSNAERVTDAIGGWSPQGIDPLPSRNPLKDMPTSFYFDYVHEPMPGKRLWLRVSADRWIERYPDGTESTFVVVGHGEVENVAGTILVKVTGDSNKTDTDNDGGFRAFIPDKHNTEMHFKYRNLDRGDQEWSDLGEMKGIE